MLKEVPLIQQLGDAAQRMSSSVVNRLNLLSKIPFLDGVYRNVSLASGDTTVSHLLGRPYQGYIVLGINANATVYDSTSSSIDNSVFIKFTSSAAVPSFKIWVF